MSCSLLPSKSGHFITADERSTICAWGDPGGNQKLQILKTTLLIRIISGVPGVWYCINEEMLGQEKLVENIKQ